MFIVIGVVLTIIGFIAGMSGGSTQDSQELGAIMIMIGLLCIHPLCFILFIIACVFRMIIR